MAASAIVVRRLHCMVPESKTWSAMVHGFPLSGAVARQAEPQSLHLMKWQSQLVLSLSLFAIVAPSFPGVAQAQLAPTPDPACACHADPAGQDSTLVPGGDKPGKTMLILGAAGLAVLSGMPFGGTSLQGLPFAAGPAPAMPSLAEVAEADGALAPETPATPTVVPSVVRAPGVPSLLDDAAPAFGIVPPNTATHLPLLAAAGLLMVGGGGLLARRDARERRRKRRFVAL